MNINRYETVKIPFTITDTNGTLMGKRVTWSVSTRLTTAKLLSKIGGLPGSSADITILSQAPNTITGTINMAVADYTALPDSEYRASLWVDDGTLQTCVTAGGAEALIINPAVSRT